MDVSSVTFELHVTHDLLDVDQARLGLKLELSLFRNGELQIGFELQRLRRSVENVRSHVDAVAHLLDVETNLVGSLRADDVYFGVLPGLNLDAAVGHVMNHDDGPPGNAELLFNALSRTGGEGGRGAPSQKSGA